MIRVSRSARRLNLPLLMFHAGGYISFVVFKRHVTTPKRLEARRPPQAARAARAQGRTASR